MASLRTTIAELQALQRRFQERFAAEQAGGGPFEPGSGPGPVEKSLTRDNPGGLRLFQHVPAKLERAPALVVALHGCNQNAAGYARGTGWSALADELGFIVLYPEQQNSNNGQSCFSWFQPGDTMRGAGEAQSIHSMVEQTIDDYAVDRQRVFVTGLSAGGAMASVMLATYPETFAGGAVIAGLPYGTARSMQDAFQAMMTAQVPSDISLGDLVRKASAHQGPWPRVSVWYGAADKVVHPNNGAHVAAQWLDVHGLDAAQVETEEIGPHVRRVWRDRSGTRTVESFTIAGMGHGVPLAADTDAHTGGVAGPFFLDVGLSSTHHIAHTWGLTKAGSAVAVKAEQAEPRARPAAGWQLDPGQLVNAVLKNAGLGASAGTGDDGGSKVKAAAIIEAALKAAGLKR